MSESTATVLSWKDVKQKVIELNPFIGNEMDQIPGVDDFKVLRVRYPYGMDIVKAGEFCINYDGQCAYFDSDKTPQNIRDMFDYFWMGIPFGMVTHNAFEAHIQLPSHIVPLRLLNPGKTFSLLTIFEDPSKVHYLQNSQNVMAGCRSLVMLPKISDKVYSERLTRKYGVHQHLNPKSLTNHWELFTELLASPQFECDWYCEVIFFSKEFVKAIEGMSEFKERLLKFIWQFTAFERNQFTYEMIWSLFEEANLDLATRNSIRVVETVKHIIRMCMSEYPPGFVPAIDNSAGPVSQLMETFDQVYRMRYFYPIMLQLASYNGKTPLYYSLNKPAFFHAIPEKAAVTQGIADTLAIKQVFELFRQKVLHNKLPISLEGTALYEMLEKTEFDFYHTVADSDKLKTDATQLMAEDPRFMQAAKLINYDRDILRTPEKAIFFNGCIRIRPKGYGSVVNA
jgi:hypothetical protein